MATNPIRTSTHPTRPLSADHAGDARLWDSLVDSSAAPDVYYRPGYAKAYQAIGHGRAVAVLVETPTVTALFPLLLRPLNALAFASDERGYDAATPYGYGGVILLDGATAIDSWQGDELLRVLGEWCRENEVVSALIRLHPVMRQDAWFANGIGEDIRLHRVRPTIAIDLRRWNTESECIATLNKGRRSDLKFARRHLRLTWASDDRELDKDLQIFFELYERRMEELDASQDYHFPANYYHSLAEGLEHRLDVGVAWLHDEPVGAALFMADRVMVHYHLSATNDLGRTYKATTLILNGAADRARQQGCQYLHLGGGARGEDKLFAFKQSFGGETYQYCFVSVIGDRQRYLRLLDRRMTAPNLPELQARFFPEYRA